MAKINYIILCEDVLKDENTNRLILNPLQHIKIGKENDDKGFKAHVGLYDVLSHKQSYKIQLELITPSLDSIDLGYTDLPILKESRSTDPLKVADLSLELLNFPFDVQGTYTLKLTLYDEVEGNESSKSISFLVIIDKEHSNE